MLVLQTLADLTDHHLYGACNICSRMDRLKMLVLYDRLGPEQGIATVSHHLQMRHGQLNDVGRHAKPVIDQLMALHPRSDQKNRNGIPNPVNDSPD